MRITFILDIQNNHLPLITFVFGTRPEAVKLAPVIIKFKKSKKFKVRVISTGQHKDLVEDGHSEKDHSSLYLKIKDMNKKAKK